MNEKTNSSGQGRHSFAFEGGEDLTTMGATWFVSYCYYDKIDPTHKNWKKVETHTVGKAFIVEPLTIIGFGLKGSWKWILSD